MKFKVRKCDKCGEEEDKFDPETCPACNGTGKRPTKESREFLRLIKPYLTIKDKWLE